MRVLLLDDEATIRAMTEHVLRTAGFDVSSFASGAEALVFLQSSVVDVILTDYHLPGLTELPLIRSLKAACPSARILVMTGSFAPEAVEQLIGPGRTIMKPFSFAELISMVKSS